MQARTFSIVVLVLASGVNAAAQASSFNIDCGSPNSVPAASYSAATTQTGFWNASDLSAFPVLLRDIAGAQSATIGVTVTGCNSLFSFDNTGTSGNDELLMDDIQDLGAANQGTTWRIGPMPSGVYRVTVYAWAPDGPPDSTLVTIVGGSLGLQTLSGSTGWIGFVLGETHVQDTVLLAAGGDIVVTADGAPNDLGSINGLQVERLEPVVYCTAKINSQGCAPSIAASGNPSATASSGFVISAVNELNQQVGLVLYSEFGRDAAAFGTGGILCVQSPARRSRGFNSGGSAPPIADCSGVFAIDFNAFGRGLLGTPPNPAAYLSVPGRAITAQFWGRDPGIAAPNNFSLSNAVEFILQP